MVWRQGIYLKYVVLENHHRVSLFIICKVEFSWKGVTNVQILYIQNLVLIPYYNIQFTYTGSPFGFDQYFSFCLDFKKNGHMQEIFSCFTYRDECMHFLQMLLFIGVLNHSYKAPISSHLLHLLSFLINKRLVEVIFFLCLHRLSLHPYLK